jgi:hypothetical protein
MNGRADTMKVLLEVGVDKDAQDKVRFACDNLPIFWFNGCARSLIFLLLAERQVSTFLWFERYR